MKKLLTLLVVAVGASAALAQGTINFSSFATGVNAPTTNAAGQRIVLSSGPYVADLFWSANTAATASQLTAAGFNAAFSTLTLNGGGYFLGGSRTINGVTTGPIIAQVRVWSTAGGNTAFDTAKNAIGGEWGQSALFLIPTLGGGVTAPPPMTAFNGGGFALTLNAVPEPTSFALAGMGLASLLIFRRRK
jgi:hypothetical protein